MSLNPRFPVIIFHRDGQYMVETTTLVNEDWVVPVISESSASEVDALLAKVRSDIAQHVGILPEGVDPLTHLTNQMSRLDGDKGYTLGTPAEYVHDYARPIRVAVASSSVARQR